ncbi:hypothetical protein [Parendozoicomonas sp. Alg238-R29]|uniref:hypothetical protein n=1 Tax=Parendozoicomonas sp. Alg238-R29 TaxID=2993446 RepID=UPI00248E6B4C|nr:hypothetical protein [Parendozoicomonas sp. Alg238-R29]
MKKLFLASAIASTLFITGCASIVSESNYPVSLKSTPSNATFSVTADNGVVVHSGQTPATVFLNSGSGFFSGAKYTITFEKPGHEPTVITVDSQIDGWYWGNLLIGGIIGMLIVDPVTGAMWKLPESASAQLNQNIAGNTDNPQLQVVTIDQVPESMKGQLLKL